MALYDLESRRNRYFHMSSELAQLDSTLLRARFDDPDMARGWGRNHTLTLGPSQVFVKRIPLTDLEYAQQFSTRNLYDLPTYYNYGVGSAGFGVFRELVANIKTTNWVLAGEIASFPLLYHYRIMPRHGARPDVDEERLRDYQAYWNGNANIGSYLRARQTASYELMLVLEHLPFTLETWLRENPHTIGRVLTDVRDAITFLRKHGIVHFDAHVGNILSDGERAYLTDFGLVLDRRFDLSPTEAQFLEQHIDYDYGEVLSCVDFLLYQQYRSLPDDDRQRLMRTYAIADALPSGRQLRILLEHIEEIIADGLVTLDQSSQAILIKYRRINLLFLDFNIQMRTNPQKDTVFPHTTLTRLLTETGFLSSASV